jgi:malonyl-CoA O-methyltransferase
MSLAKKQIAQQFSRAAKTYDEVAQLQFEMAERLIDRIPLASTGALVDLGCGTGHALKLLSQFPCLKLTGIDLAEGMIERCQSRLADAPSSIELMVRDLEQTQLPTNSADIAFSSAAIQWCESKVAFAEFSRILRPGGTLLVSTFGPATLSRWKQAWLAIGDQHQRVNEFETVDDLANSLRAAGINDLEITSEVHTAVFTSTKTMLDSIKKLGGTNASQSRPTGLLGRKKYRKLIDYFANQLEADGQLVTEFECIFIHAKNKA